MFNREEQIPVTNADSKYEGTVEDILRDKASGWKNDYYGDTRTGYDVHCAIAANEVLALKKQIKRFEAELEKITASIEGTKAAPSNKLTAKQIEELELQYIETYKQKCEQMVLLDAAEDSQRGFEWKKYMQAKRLTLLQWIRNRFMYDGDEEYMKKAVTCISRYIEELRASSLA